MTAAALIIGTALDAVTFSDVWTVPVSQEAGVFVMGLGLALVSLWTTWMARR